MRLETSDSSRFINDPQFESKLNSSGIKLYYSATYRGADSSYYGATTDNEYNASEGILLSQGLWRIDCEWKDSENTIIANGSTGDVWVNLNTDSFLVYLDSASGEGSLTFSYDVKSSDESVSSVCCFVESITKINGNVLDETPTLSNIKLTGVENEGSIGTFTMSSYSLPVGRYLMIIKVYEGEQQSASKLLYTDVLGLVVIAAHETVITGDCDVKKGTTGSGIYLDMINNPHIPVEGTTSSDGNNQVFISGNTDKKLNELATNMVTVIVGSETNPNSFQLDRVNTDISSQRINSPTGNSAMNLNGTDVNITKAKQGNTGNENALITVLNEGITLTIFNNTDNVPDSVTQKSARTAAFAYLTGEGQNPHVINRRLQSNLDMNGSTLNVVGKGASDPISNGGILFIGPEIYHDNVKSTERRQGDINFFGEGGKVVLDGDVIMKGIVGISSWPVQKGSSDPYSIITADLDTALTILKGASINVTSDSTSEDNEGNYAYGMALLCNKQGGQINVTLNNGSISTTASSGAISSGIYIQDFNGEAKMNISASSSFNAVNGNGIYLKNCSYTVDKKIEITIDGSTMNCSTGAIRIEDCSAEIIIRVKDSTLSASGDYKAIEVSNSNNVKVYINDDKTPASLPIKGITPSGVTN